MVLGEERSFNLEGKKILMIIAPENFRDEEYFQPKEIFLKSGAEVTTASLKTGKIKGMLGGIAEAEITLDDVNVAYYDAIIFSGGSGATVYFDNEKALRIAKEAFEKGKVVGAICIAPAILANAGILKGKNATVWKSDETLKIFEEQGVNYTGKDVEVAGNIITANGPHAAKEFAYEIARHLE